MKKLLVLAIVAIMVISMAACGGPGNTSGEIPTLIWYVPGEPQDDMATVLAEANKIVEAEIGAKIDLQFIPQASYTERIQMLMASQQEFNMMLTGYDSKRINTLFLDKSLKYHGLIQAFSRTNRLDCSAKQFGNIICYRTTPKDVEKAINLYSQGDHNVVIMKPFEEYVELFRGALKYLREYTLTPDDVDALEGDVAKIEFVNRFRKLAKVLICLQNFCEFSFSITLQDDITADEYNSFKSKYLDIYNEFKKHPEKVSVVGEVSFDIELVHTEKIDVDYILNLLRKYKGDNKKINLNLIVNILKKSTDPILVSKRELLEQFITTVFPTLGSDASIDDELAKFIEEQRKEKLTKVADEYDVAYDELNKLINRYDYFRTIDYADIKPLLNKKVKAKYKEKHPEYNPIAVTNKLMEEIKQYIIEIASEFSINSDY